MKKKEIMAMAAIGIVMVACSDNELHEHGNDWKGNEPLELSASISETIQTRANEPASGTYYFSYVKNGADNSTYSTIDVEFNNNGDATPNLTWGGINKSSVYFILDNINKTATNNSVSFDDDDTFDAGPAPANPGEGNDLLWDIVKVANVISAPLSPVHFVLEHRMAMLTFDLYSKNDEIKELLKQNVTVKLEGVITEPTKFNRVTGNVSVSYTGGNVTSDIENMGVLEPTEDEEKGVARCTKSWIFPPQQFHNIGRPVLEITLSKNEGTETITKTFRGRLPESMIYNNKSELLEFISGCHLIIEVELGDVNNMEIRFRPVLVRKWIPKTIVDINVDQVGVRTAEELSDLVTKYNNNPNDPILWRYGVLKNNNGESTWYFDLWSNIDNYIKPSDSSTSNDLGFKTDQTPGFIINSHNYKVNDKTVNEYGNLKDEDTTTP